MVGRLLDVGFSCGEIEPKIFSRLTLGEARRSKKNLREDTS